MNEAIVCAVCGKAGTTKWTINNGADVAIVELCAEHGAPLRDVMEIAAESLPRKQDPAWAAAQKLPRKVVRRTSFEPLDWKPPAT